MSNENPRPVQQPPAAPSWRRGYDAFESVLGPPLEQWVRSDLFARGVGLASQIRSELERRASRATRHVLHRLNLPAGTDVTRLLTEIGELKKQVRQLTEQLQAREQSAQARARPHRSASTRQESTRARTGG